MIKKIKPKKPSREWELGAAACRQGEDQSANPFERHTSSSYRWAEGWLYQNQQLNGPNKHG